MTTSRVEWVLASASPRRREILARLGLRFCVHPSAIPEPLRRPYEIPSRYTVRAARLKAQEVSRKYESQVVIGADSVVIAGNRFMGKPSCVEEARAMLRSLNGRWHEVVTGICLIDCRTRRAASAHSLSRVHFRRLSKAEMDWYLDTGEHRDKAGAYAIQGYASLFIDRIEGCYFNVVGFPVATFERLCRQMGLPLLPSCAWESGVECSPFAIRDSQ